MNHRHHRSIQSITEIISNNQTCAVCCEDLGLEEQQQKFNGNNDNESAFAYSTGAAATNTNSSLLTTVCNHTFHLVCLQKCTGPCPLCRYDHSGLNETLPLLSKCHACGTTEHNYVCLICGVVSCGVPFTAEVEMEAEVEAAMSTTTTTTTSPPRFYRSSHAGQHYNQTLHAYALDTQTQHVYDFCGRGYVYRLAQNKEDGKLVEVNNPNTATHNVDVLLGTMGDNNTLVAVGGRTAGERSLTPGLSDTQEGEVVHRKLEGAAERYNSLLKSQLEAQRASFEERLNELKREFSAKTNSNNNNKAEDLVSVLKQERKQVAQHLSSLRRRKFKILDDVAFLTSMNESLEANKPALKHRIQQAGRERNESREFLRKRIPELEEEHDGLMKRFVEA